jgi:hypothetical protein
MVNAITSHANDKPEYAVAFLERKFPERWGRAVATTPVNVNVNVSSLLQQIEGAAARRDPRPPLEGRKTILDVIAESSKPLREPVAFETNDNREPDATDPSRPE